jgi:hypothetical protein
LIPAAVKKYASNIPYPVALVGCRASKGSLDCCEYDLAVFAPSYENQVVTAAGHTVEVVCFSGRPQDYIVDLHGMVVIKDSNKFALSSAAQGVGVEKYRKALAAAGKKSLISSLFCQQKMGDAKNPVVAAMWLKIAAYDYISGALALSGSRPMPLHELAQVRQIKTANGVADGLEAALECIGIERATRPAISRSIEAVMELKSKDYDRELAMSKIKHLLEKRMLADCYYYAGKIAAKNLAGRNSSFHSKYGKLVQLAMDLSSDASHLQKLQKRLFRAAQGGLKR